ncbi:MAG: transcription antitermination protein [Haloferacaceae archaeon]
MDETDGESLLAAVREAEETPLSRLGSSKALYAVTGGEMTSAAVRAATADDAAAAAALFDGWAGETTGPAADTFADAAARAERHRDRVAPDDHEPSADLPLYDHLATLDGDAARAAGLLGRALVVGERLEQTVGFFVGDADPQGADELRDLRADLEAERADAVALLDAVCADADDWTLARETAVGVVEAAYDDYVERLEAMGVKPKNVC